MSDLGSLADLKYAKSARASSWDRTGGNADFLKVAPRSTVLLADIRGSGKIAHIWVTVSSEDPFVLRTSLLRMFWDGERKPSVLVPLGDFFGVGHCKTVNYSTPVLSMAPENGKGMNCYFPMPFGSGARIELVNESKFPVKHFYYYIDYETYPPHYPLDEVGRFHAQWRRENPCRGKNPAKFTAKDQFGGRNRTGKDNYVILEARGRGHYVGCHLDIQNLRATDEWNWYGEGDDMIFIDGEKWPPSLHGTGTEDYFGMAWCPTQFHNGVWNGLLLPGGENYSRAVTCYRYHVPDPVRFSKSIKVTIEHGHANLRSDDYSSTAYWYQAEPHKAFGIAASKLRIP